MSPGRYLRRRREAAGLSIADVALMLSATPGCRPATQAWLAEIEDDRITADRRVLDQLRGAFRFDIFIHGQLVAGLPTPALCRFCACSWADPCDDERDGPCSWVEGHPELCTACLGKPPSAASLRHERTNHAA